MMIFLYKNYIWNKWYL